MARENGEKKHRDARPGKRLGHDLGAPFDELLAPGEDDDVGGRLAGDVGDVIGRDARRRSSFTRSCGVAMWRVRNSRSQTELAWGS